MLKGAERLFLTVAAVLAFAGVGNAHPAWGIALDAAGRVYFTDIKNVWKIDTDGQVSMARRGGDWQRAGADVSERGTRRRRRWFR